MGFCSSLSASHPRASEARPEDLSVHPRAECQRASAPRQRKILGSAPSAPAEDDSSRELVFQHSPLSSRKREAHSQTRMAGSHSSDCSSRRMGPGSPLRSGRDDSCGVINASLHESFSGKRSASRESRLDQQREERSVPEPHQPGSSAQGRDDSVGNCIAVRHHPGRNREIFPANSEPEEKSSGKLSYTCRAER